MLGNPTTRAFPAVWKRTYGLLKQDKEASRQLAIRRFPDAAPLLQRKKDKDRAKALLIAHHHDMVHWDGKQAA